MSRTTILAIYPEDRINQIQELHNSWRSAPLVWESIWNRYGVRKGEYDDWPQAAKDGRLWKLATDSRLKSCDKALLSFTFDRWYVAKKDYAKAAQDIGSFMEANNIGAHWVTIRDLFLSDPDYPGIGFWWTSVSENPFIGKWNEELQNYDPLDWSDVTSVYDNLESIASDNFV